MPALKPLSEQHSEMDGHHLLAFRRSLPWWFRPTQRSTEYTVPDFVADVRKRLKKVIQELSPEMAVIFNTRHKMADSIAYRLARDSASIAKTGYGTDAFTEFIAATVRIFHTNQRWAIPHGDPNFGKYGTPTNEHHTSQTIYIVDLTGPEKQLMHWLNYNTNLQTVLNHPMLAPYKSIDPETGFMLYAPDMRARMRAILDGQQSDDTNAQWRTQCVDLAMDELLKAGGNLQQERVNAMTARLSYDILATNPSRAIDDIIQPNIHDAQKTGACFAVLEQLLAVAAQVKNVEHIKIIVDAWNRLMTFHNVAACERPTGGIAAILAKCAADNVEEVRSWLGPQPTARKTKNN